MNNNYDKLIRTLKETTLSVAEKGEMKASLMAQIAQEKTAPAKPVTSPYFSWLVIFQSRRLQVGFASLFAVIMIGSTVIVGANNSLPGDFLYPIKTDFNEEFQRSLVPANDPAAQVEFETKLVEKRFIEAEQLDSQQELTGARKAEVRKEIEKQTQKAVEKEVRFQGEETPKIKQANSKRSDDLAPEVDQNFSTMSAPATTMMKVATGTDEITATSSEKERDEDTKRTYSENREKLEKILEKHRDIWEKLDDEEDRGLDIDL